MNVNKLHFLINVTRVDSSDGMELPIAMRNATSHGAAEIDYADIDEGTAAQSASSPPSPSLVDMMIESLHEVL